MSGIFISHSSKDKPFVTRLAIDLVNKGFPVWFDSWEIEIGDGLYNKIYEGIDESTLLLILLSPNSVGSDWVDRELNAALVKENALNKKFIIPLVVHNCERPLKIADRIYADFSQEYLPALENLCRVLERQGARNIHVTPEKQIIPFNFFSHVHLDRAKLSARLQQLYNSSPHYQISLNQVVITEDETYRKLRGKASHRMEHILTDPFFSPDFHKIISDDYQTVLANERQYVEGIVFLINRFRTTGNVVEACYWYARERRANLFYLLWNMQNPQDGDKVSRNMEWQHWLMSNKQAAEFYGVPDVERYDVFDHTGEGRGTSVYVSAQSSLNEYFEKMRPFFMPEPLSGFEDGELYAKFLAPQILLAHQRGFCSWLFDCRSLMVGKS